MNTVLLLFVAVAVTLFATSAYAIEEYPKTYYGYITINKTYDSAMFYAIRGNNDKENRRSQPYVIVLQGGPGKTSLYSAYLGTGPETCVLDFYDNSLEPNNHSWTKYATMVYVDNPVGTGYSYSKDPRGLSTSDEEIAENLRIFIKGFWERHPEYKSNKLWVMGHGYGAKMAAHFGEQLYYLCNFQQFGGVILASPWISPLSCMHSYAPYLKSLGQCSKTECEQIESQAGYAANAVEAGNWERATDRFFEQKKLVSTATAKVSWDDIRSWFDNRSIAESHVDYFLEHGFLEIPEVIMANITHKYNSQGDDVYKKLYNSYMKDATDKLDFLLRQGSVNGELVVHVYNGEYDLQHNSLCTHNWLRRLPLYHDAYTTKKKAFKQPGYPNKIEGFYQGRSNYFGSLYRWWVNDVGAYIVENNGFAGEYIISNIINGNNLKKRHK